MLNWVPCELHAHTRESDGDFTVPELLHAARDCGLSCIAMTDHNTASGCLQVTPELEAETVKVIPGIEWTTFFGHLVVLGTKKFVDWRDAVPDNIDEKLREIRDAGGVAGVAHAYSIGSPICTGCKWDYHVRDWNLVGYIEIWSDLMPPIQCGNRRALSLWTGLLDQGYHLACGNGRDWHGPDTSGEPDAATYLGIVPDSGPDGIFSSEKAEVTPEGALEALRAGRSYVSMAPEIDFRAAESSGRQVSLGSTVSPGAEFSASVRLDSRREIWGRHTVTLRSLRLVGKSGKVLREVPLGAEGGTFALGKAKGSHWVRAEVIGEMNGILCQLAITSPIYIEEKPLA